jgi:hypothetical protein
MNLLLGFFLSAIPLFIMIGIVVFALRKLSHRTQPVDSTEQPVRLFFQYALAFGLFIIFTVGIAGLLSRILDTANIVNADQSSLASNLAFVVVGGPLLAGIIIWLRKSISQNPSDGHGPVPTLFATLAATISLLVFMTSAIAALHNLINADQFAGVSAAKAIVWGSAWLIVLKISNSVIPKNDFRIQYFVGSAITALASLIALIQVLSGVFSALLLQKMFLVNQPLLLVSPVNPLEIGLGTLAISGALWFYYWIRNANTIKSDTLWLGYVLIAGVGGSLILAITSLSVSLYQVLVWFFGEPYNQKIAEHFAGIPLSLAVASAGLMFWWYHKSLLPTNSERNDIQRTYEYLMAAISLIASAIGISIVIVALIEASTSQAILAGSSAINTLLGAATVIAVAGPIWWHFWNRIQKVAKSSPESEHGSPIRRIYLFLLFGVGGVVAIISLITIVYQIFNSLLGSGLGANTLNEMRSAIGTLASTGIVAAYHWEIYRHEKDVEVFKAPVIANILIVGPKNLDLIQTIAQTTGARVSYLQSANSDELTWPVENVVELVNQNKGQDLLIFLESAGVKVIPIVR